MKISGPMGKLSVTTHENGNSPVYRIEGKTGRIDLTLDELVLIYQQACVMEVFNDNPQVIEYVTGLPEKQQIELIDEMTANNHKVWKEVVAMVKKYVGYE